jgi:hypothetical protein
MQFDFFGQLGRQIDFFHTEIDLTGQHDQIIVGVTSARVGIEKDVGGRIPIAAKEGVGFLRLLLVK